MNLKLASPRLALGVLVCWLALGSCSASPRAPEDAPQSRPDPNSRGGEQASDRPTLEYVTTELRAYGYDDDPYHRFMDIIRFSNPTSSAFEFMGEDVTWPLWTRAFQTEQGDWVEEGRRIFCATGLEVQQIEAGEIAYFPAHSTRSIVEELPGQFSRVQLKLTNVATGEDMTIWTEGFLPQISQEDEAKAANLDEYGEFK